MPFASRTRHLDFMLRHAGVPCWTTSALQVAYGKYRSADEQIVKSDGSTLVGRVESVLFRTGSLAFLEEGKTINVKGTSYRIIGVAFENDGEEVRVRIAPV